MPPSPMGAPAADQGIFRRLLLKFQDSFNKDKKIPCPDQNQRSTEPAQARPDEASRRPREAGWASISIRVASARWSYIEKNLHLRMQAIERRGLIIELAW